MSELASVMDAAPLPVLASNEDGYYVYENEAARRFLGYGPAEIVGKRLSDLIAYDPMLVAETVERLKRQGHLSGLTRFWHTDGRVCHANVNIFGQNLADGTRVFVSLVHPLRGVAAGMPQVQPAGSGHSLNASEIRLLHLIADGFSDEQMATLLGQTAQEVALEVPAILAKMNAHSRTEVAVRALKARVIH